MNWTPFLGVEGKQNYQMLPLSYFWLCYFIMNKAAESGGGRTKPLYPLGGAGTREGMGVGNIWIGVT